MASLIEQNGDFVSYRQKAWHGLGTIFQNALTVNDALTYGGLDFTVEKAPNIHRTPSGVEIVSDKSFFTYRTDNDRILGDYVGKNYTILQNHDALGFLDEVVEKGDLEIETAGALSGGAKVFVCAKVKKPIIVNGHDESYQYIVLCNGHDGLMAVQAFFTTVRVVCNNTLQLALKNCQNKISIKHTTNVKANTNQALKVLGVIEANQQCANEGYNHLAQIRMSQNQFSSYLANLFLEQEEIIRLKNREAQKEVLSTRKSNIIASVVDYCYNGVGQSEAGEMSAWWAYNGVTGFFNNCKSYKTPEHRMTGLLWGYDGDTMNQAIKLAAQPAKIPSVKLDLSLLN
ncbi:DUF932 domain-containing protein [Runella salmonicolor]|uniref:DUF932 domain-containing protein n=1 Tax=Runella salmonicolor TaxID=2950278 RepID=A0ABT1FSQ8_9BACT|nr:DUF932 domain-containing protein [Runella salmonicolor]MCP1384779.1 DUF932 domain-containing protein [Runella salmonicolor]